eukprot:1184728-Prorocentrum_minimum.AAC.1
MTERLYLISSTCYVHHLVRGVRARLAGVCAAAGRYCFMNSLYLELLLCEVSGGGLQGVWRGIYTCIK